MPPYLASAAGTVATMLFVAGTLPMLYKAARTRDLASYSGANLVVATVGNVLQAVYLSTLPAGPVWALHAFNTGATGLMLVWWLRHRARDRRARDHRTRHSVHDLRSQDRDRRDHDLRSRDGDRRGRDRDRPAGAGAREAVVSGTCGGR